MMMEAQREKRLTGLKLFYCTLASYKEVNSIIRSLSAHSDFPKVNRSLHRRVIELLFCENWLGNSTQFIRNLSSNFNLEFFFAFIILCSKNQALKFLLIIFCFV